MTWADTPPWAAAFCALVSATCLIWYLAHSKRASNRTAFVVAVGGTPVAMIFVLSTQLYVVKTKLDNARDSERAARVEVARQSAIIADAAQRAHLAEVQAGLAAERQRSSQLKTEQLAAEVKELQTATAARVATDLTSRADAMRRFQELEAQITAPTSPRPSLSPPLDLAKSGILAIEKIDFVSNRALKPSDRFQLSSLTSARSTDLSFGSALVSIPKTHSIGRVERPATIFGMTFRKERSDKDFIVQSISQMTRDQFVNDLRTEQGSILIFVHGYNTTVEDALFKAAQIKYDANFTGTAIVFSWPSRGGLLDYDYDRESARFSRDAFVSILATLTKNAPDRKLYIVAHSMGNQVVSDALDEAAIAHQKLKIAELVMAAPDVDRDVFLTEAERIKSVAGTITLYASAADKALLASQGKAGGPRLGYIGQDGPFLLPGIETIDVTAVGDDLLALDHGTFSSSRSVLDDLSKLISSDMHPPNKRTPTLRTMSDDLHPTYWVYPQ